MALSKTENMINSQKNGVYFWRRRSCFKEQNVFEIVFSVYLHMYIYTFSKM